MKKQPLFDVSRFNRIADKYNIPWIDRIPLIETVCWGSKGWLDSALVAKLRGRWNGYRRNARIRRVHGRSYVRAVRGFSAQVPAERLATYQAQLASIGANRARHIPV